MPRKTINLGNTPFFIPPHTRGDREFDGHGPRITIVTRLRVIERHKIQAEIFARFQEDRSDWTTAEGSISVHVFDGSHDPEIDRINFIVSPGASNTFQMTQAEGHEGFVRSQEAGPVREYYLVGDTRGSEAGTRSGVEVRFRPIEIDYEPRVVIPETKDVLPDPVEFIPPHTRGDRDFGGHGPRILCNARLQIRNRREIWAEVFMHAEETKSDWTTASGSDDFLLHTNDRPIAAILTDTFSACTYTDSNHEEDVVAQSAGELVSQFKFVGDTRGDEAGTRTRVLLIFNPIVFREAA
jgi:hypothetical protein